MLVNTIFMEPTYGEPVPVSRPIYSGNTPVSAPAVTRAQLNYMDLDSLPKPLRRAAKDIKRGTFVGDVTAVLTQIGLNQNQLQRAIQTTNTAFPVRENLESEAKILIPLDTPLRNKITRTPGAGLASKWKQLTSLGGGYAGATNVATNSAAGAVNLIVASVAGFAINDTVSIDSGANLEYRVISGINTGTLTLTFSVAMSFAHTAAAGNLVVKYGINPGSQSTGAVQAFFAETGAPAEHTSVYADKTASYKLLGVLGKVTGFAMAAGANFQNQLAVEKTNAIRNLMLNEENALINGDSTSILAPWGDGTNNLAFDGLLNLITTGNGTPAENIQTSVGALTLAHIDAQLGRLFRQGGTNTYMILNEQEARSLTHLAESTGSIVRVMATSDGQVTLGAQVTGYKHPITGEIVKIYISRLLSPGTMIFGADSLPDGSPSLDVQVLPQVQLPTLAPNQNIQGYTAQEVAPSITAPQVFPFIITVYEVLRMKSALHFCKSTGVQAV